MTRVATQMALGVSFVIAGLALSGSATAQSTPLQRWQNANTSNGTFFLGVKGGQACNLSNGSCGVKNGTQTITYQQSAEDQEMRAPVVNAVGTIQNYYNDADNMALTSCLGVANNSKSLSAGVVSWDCQSMSQGPGQYWKALSAEGLGAPFPGCFAFVNQNASTAYPANKPVVMSVSGGSVQNGSGIIQYTLCTPTNGACGSPSNAFHADQFWCPVAVQPWSPAGSVSLVGGSGWGSIPVATSHGDGWFTVTVSQVPQFNSYAGQHNAWRMTGDFDGNGMTDWLALNSEYNSWSTIPIALSNGDGTFRFTNASTPDFSGWARTTHVIPYVGDFNGDHRSDLALVPYDRYAGWSTLPVALSNGDGSFTVRNFGIDGRFLGSALFGAIKVGDYNGDGRSDLAVVDGGNNQQGDDNMYVALSRGDGSFDVVFQVPWGLYSSPCPNFPRFAPLVGRFDRDPYDDLGGVGPENTLCTALSNGDGTFRIVSSSVAFNNETTWSWDPTDRPDYFPPILARNSVTNERIEFEPAGTGDYDGDGCTDYVLFGQGPNYIYTLHSQCDGTFALWSSAGGNFSNWVADSQWVLGVPHIYADFNNDGKTDILLTGVSGWGSIPVAFSNGDGTFTITNNGIPNFPGWSSSAFSRANGRLFQ